MTPPEVAQAPIEITHFGSGIWSYSCRITGAIFCDSRPATIIRSACRGDGRNTSAPKRATSNREAAIDIISMAQHANPNPSGQIELLRAQFTALSSCVKMMPSSCSSLPKSSGLLRVTLFPRLVVSLITPLVPCSFSHTPCAVTNGRRERRSLLTEATPAAEHTRKMLPYPNYRLPELLQSENVVQLVTKVASRVSWPG